jgi:hypothetical protein
METITHFGGNIGFANSNHGAMTSKGNITVKIGDGDFYGAMLEVGTNKQSVTAKMKALMQGMLSNLKETAKSILVCLVVI